MAILDTLYQKAFDGDAAAVKTEVQRQPDIVNERIDNQDMLLHAACWGRQLELAVWLIDQGANVNAKGCSGYSPLHYAVFEGNAKSRALVQSLLASQADPDIEDMFGFTPAEVAKRDMDAGLPEVLGLLLHATKREVLPDMRMWPDFHRCIFLGDYQQACTFILAHPGSINELGKDSLAALHVACWARQLMVDAFVDMGADPNLRGFMGRTPLHYAVHDEGGLNSVIVETLIRNGADVNLRDGAGNTPVDWAKVRIRTGLEKVLSAFGSANQ